MRKGQKNSANSFVGRVDAVKEIEEVLVSSDRDEGRLAVQSIEGSGGIGKSYLLDHVMRTTDLHSLNYLTLRLNGNDQSASYVDSAVSHMVNNASAIPITKNPGGHFPKVAEVISTIGEIRTKAADEIRKKYPNVQEASKVSERYLNLFLNVGEAADIKIPGT